MPSSPRPACRPRSPQFDHRFHGLRRARNRQIRQKAQLLRFEKGKYALPRRRFRPIPARAGGNEHFRVGKRLRWAAAPLTSVSPCIVASRQAPEGAVPASSSSRTCSADRRRRIGCSSGRRSFGSAPRSSNNRSPSRLSKSSTLQSACSPSDRPPHRAAAGYTQDPYPPGNDTAIHDRSDSLRGPAATASSRSRG